MGGQTSSLRVTGGGEMAVRADVEGAVLAIVTCARAPKAFGKSGSGATRNGDVEEARWGRNDRTIVSELYDKRPVDVHSVFIQAVFGVNSGEGRKGVGWSWRG